MRAELRALHSPDAPEGWDKFLPVDPRSFSILIQAMIGPSGSPGAESFDFLAVGPDWFGNNPPGKGFRWGCHLLILDRWDSDVVRRSIEDLCLHAEGRDWDEVATKLSRHGKWEFEDCRP